MPGNKSLKPNTVRWVAAFVVVAAIVSCVYFLAIYTNQFGNALSKNHEKWAQAGDFFGGTLSVVLLLLTLVVVAYSLWQNAEVLRLTKRTYEETRKEARAARDQAAATENALSAQTKLMSDQAYTQAVSQMIRIKDAAVDKLSWILFLPDQKTGDPVTNLTGKDAVVEVVKQIVVDYNKLLRDSSRADEVTNKLALVKQSVRENGAANDIRQFYVAISSAMRLSESLLDEGHPLYTIYRMSVTPYEHTLAVICSFAYGDKDEPERLTKFLGGVQITIPNYLGDFLGELASVKR